MRTFVNVFSTNDVVKAFDLNVYKQERQLIISEGSGKASLRLTCDQFGLDATFYADKNGVVVIDVTDIIRLASTGSMTLTDGTSSLPLSWNVVGLISPASVIIPFFKNETALTIAPPSMIYQCTTPISMDVMRKTEDTVTIADIPLLRNVLTSISVSGPFDIVVTHRSRPIVLQHIELREQLCGHRYAVVKWTSVFGKEKVFVWEVVENTSAASDSINLFDVREDYNQLKGREDSLTLYLDNLNAYDMWYYSDIATSCKVEVSIDGGVTFRRVEVTTKSVSIPDGDAGKMNELKINVNYRHYDAVTM